jgi:hypothetical protein
VKEALVATGDGARVLPVPAGVVRGDGSVPTQAEATALAVLALEGDKDAPLADLGAALLGGYSPSWGWGDGRTNLVCMQAVLRLFKDPIPAGVKITLTMDGKPVAEGAIEQARLREVLALDVEAPGLAGAHEWKLVAEPAVPGLGYSLTLHSWVPWGAQEARGGVELALAAPESAQVGKPADVQVTAIAPSGRTLTITQSLPAGVQVDTPSLQALVDAGTLSRFDTSDGKVVLVSPPLAPAQTFSARYRVIPTLAGTLHSSASTLDAGGVVFFVPPVVWTVK